MPLKPRATLRHILDSIDENKRLCQRYVNHVYHPPAAQKTCVNSLFQRGRTISETYGEILYASVDILLSKLSIAENDVFVDLGSGLGKVALQFFLRSPVKEVYGIEIIPELHQQALQVAATVQQDLPDFYVGERKLTFLLGNFLEMPLTMASIVLIGSPCFTPSMLDTLSKMIDDTPSIHTVLSLRPLSTLKRLSFKKALRVECSWDTALCYLYQIPISA